MARFTKEQTQEMADRAEARSAGEAAVVTEYGEEWERGFYETCDQAKRDHDRDSGVYEAEIERLALLSDLDYQIERKAAAKRLNNIPVSALDRMVKAKRPKKPKPAAPEINSDELRTTASHIIDCPDSHDDEKQAAPGK